MNVTSFLISKVIAEKEGLDKDAANRMGLTGAISGTAQQVLVTQQMAKTAVAAKPETIQKEIGNQGLATKDDLEGVVSAKLPAEVTNKLPAEVAAKLPEVVAAKLPEVVESELTLSKIAGKLGTVTTTSEEAKQLVQMVAQVLAEVVNNPTDQASKELKDNLGKLTPKPK